MGFPRDVARGKLLIVISIAEIAELPCEPKQSNSALPASMIIERLKPHQSPASVNGCAVLQEQKLDVLTIILQERLSDHRHNQTRADQSERCVRFDRLISDHGIAAGRLKSL